MTMSKQLLNYGITTKQELHNYEITKFLNKNFPQFSNSVIQELSNFSTC